MASTQKGEPFEFKKALILTKFSRYEFEKRRNPEWSEEQLKNNLQKRGSDYNNLKRHNEVHSAVKTHVIEVLKKFGIETRVVDRHAYSKEAVEWADVIFTTGGDGTFLMAASKVLDKDKPVIGVNTDAESSVGHLLLPVAFSKNFTKAIERLQSGDFHWLHRQRIRITVEGENAHEDAVELHDQQLTQKENRFLDLEPQDLRDLMNSPDKDLTAAKFTKRTLPVRALNEVFVGEILSSKVSYYEISTDDSSRVKLKSSGLTICTGTGSTSWTFNINKVTMQCVSTIFDIIEQESNVILPKDPATVEKVMERFNSTLLFDPSEKKLAYTIRDPVVWGTNLKIAPRGFVDQVELRSRMFDACLVVDGALSYKFNDGARAKFEIFEEDSLKTVLLQ
ncbi:NAD kinase 2, mitochondrial [Halotydeus destructor]|nr:NAD kinase 2, mitochondrial [Halotydeus destructor]